MRWIRSAHGEAVDRCIQIHQPSHPLGVAAREGGEFIAGDRMAHQHHPLQPEAIEGQAQVVHPGGHVVPRGGGAGAAETPAGEGHHGLAPGQQGRQVVVDGSGVAEPGEQHQGEATTGVALVQGTPVAHLQVHGGADLHPAQERTGTGVSEPRGGACLSRHGKGQGGSRKDPLKADLATLRHSDLAGRTQEIDSVRAMASLRNR